jgi:peroxiredoxin
VELRNALLDSEDLAILYVLPDNQINAKTHWFINGNDLAQRIVFLQDPNSAAIDQLNLRRPNPEPMEEGVPHPATYLLDREGVVRLVDVREDFHVWLDPEPVLDALAKLP